MYAVSVCGLPSTLPSLASAFSLVSPLVEDVFVSVLTGVAASAVLATTLALSVVVFVSTVIAVPLPTSPPVFTAPSLLVLIALSPASTLPVPVRGGDRLTPLSVRGDALAHDASNVRGDDDELTCADAESVVARGDDFSLSACAWQHQKVNENAHPNTTTHRVFLIGHRRLHVALVSVIAVVAGVVGSLQQRPQRAHRCGHTACIVTACSRKTWATHREPEGHVRTRTYNRPHTLLDAILAHAHNVIAGEVARAALVRALPPARAIMTRYTHAHTRTRTNPDAASRARRTTRPQ
jgi:hypothetical protein